MQPDLSSGFSSTLRARVRDCLRDHGRTRFGERRYVVKALVYLAIYATAYVALLVRSQDRGDVIVHWIGLGVAQALVAFNIPHDASHGSATSSRVLNKAFSHVFELVGLSTYVWHVRHDLAHHVYPNQRGWDPDIDGGPLLRMSPEDPLKPIHRYQHLYAPFFYMLTGPLLTLFVDFRWLVDDVFAARIGITHPRGAFARLVAGKVVYLGYMLGLPMWILPIPWWEVVICFMAANMIVGLFVALVLLPAHGMEHAHFEAKDPDGDRDADAIRQLKMTLDYAPESAIANWLFGGFSTNAIHHVLPDVSHVHHRLVNPVLVRTAEEFGVVYRRTTLLGAIRSHFRFLRRMGRDAKASG